MNNIRKPIPVKGNQQNTRNPLERTNSAPADQDPVKTQNLMNLKVEQR